MTAESTQALRLWNELRRYSCGITDEVAAAEILISFQFQSQFQRCDASQHSADQTHDRLGVGSRLFQPQRINDYDKCFISETQR